MEIRKPGDHRRFFFSCHGSVGLIPMPILRVGDTASGTDAQDDRCLWRCESIRGSVAEWICLGDWSEPMTRDLIREADLVCVVNPPWQTEGLTS